MKLSEAAESPRVDSEGMSKGEVLGCSIACNRFCAFCGEPLPESRGHRPRQYCGAPCRLARADLNAFAKKVAAVKLSPECLSSLRSELWRIGNAIPRRAK